jgi:hypothetical protein
MRARMLAVVLGVVAGAVAGYGMAGSQMERHRRDLFSRKPFRRLAALAHLARTGGVESAGLLRDYLAWESHPILRRRAERILRRLDVAFG